MGNALEFILKLTDQLSPAMRQAQRISDTAGAQMQKQFAATETSSRRMAASVDELRTRLEAVNRIRFSTTIQSEFNAATRSARQFESQIAEMENRGSGGNFLSKYAGMFSGAAIGYAAFNAGKSAIKAAADYEQQRISYGVMTGSQGKGDALLGSLRNYANVTPYQMNDVTGGAQTLLQFGVNQKNILPQIKMLGDVAAGNAEKLKSLTLAYAQIQSAGRLQGQDLLQLVNAGFNPLLEISRSTGVSMADLKVKMEKGAISADMVTKAFQHATGPAGEFYQMTEKQSQTLSGKWSTVMDSVQNKLLDIGNALTPLAHKALDFTLNMLNGGNSVAMQVQAQREKIYQLQIQLSSANVPLAERKTILDQLAAISPQIVSGISAEAIQYGKLSDNIQNVVNGLNKKTIAQKIQDDNAGMIGNYMSARDKSTSSLQDVYVTMGKIADRYPYLAQNSTMSFGQKQLEAARALRATIVSGHDEKYYVGGGNGGTGAGAAGVYKSKEQDLLQQLLSQIHSNQAANATVSNLTPAFAKTQGDIARITSEYNKALGITTISTGGKTGNGGDDGSGNFGLTGVGKTRSEAINSGGQRSIVINIGKQIEKLEVHVMDAKEGANEIESMVRETMRRVMLSINGLAVSQ